MRKALMFLLTFGVVVVAVRGVSASTDCQRWLSDYKQALADKASTQKLLAAKKRARAYAHRRLVQLTTANNPAPHPPRLASSHPHLTPAQMVKRFDLLCGDLPVEPQVLDARMEPDEFMSETAMGGPVDAVGVPADQMIAENDVPAYDGPNVNGLVPSNGGGYPPTYYGPTPGGGVPPGPLPATPNRPSVPAVPIAPIPEPSSLLLLATGSLGAAAVMRRRFI